MSLPRSIVERARDHVAASLRHVLHRRPLRQVLANQPVGVFVRATLPGAVGVGEVDEHASSALDLFVTVKLRPVVDRDRFEQAGMGLDQFDHTCVERDYLPAAKLPDQCRSGHPFDQRDDAVLIAGADHDVHLPVTDLGTHLSGGGPLGDVALAAESAALLGRPVTLAIPRRLPKVPPERSAALFVATDVRVDRLATDVEDLEKTQPAAHLFGTELLTQQKVDKLPLRSSELAVPTGA